MGQERGEGLRLARLLIVLSSLAPLFVLMAIRGNSLLRPSAFESLAELNQRVLESVPENVAAIASDLLFVDFSGVEDYAKSRPRAPSYLASIRSQ